MMIFLNLLLFIVSLALLIIVHELGHFSMAKAFGVYCFEFSIGFGPKLFRKKRKTGETFFAIRAIPLGGYVSMYGEGDASEIEEGLNIPVTRSIEGVKKWKKAIILSAGIILNFVLAYVLFFISYSCVPWNKMDLNTLRSLKDQQGNEIVEVQNIDLYSDLLILKEDALTPKYVQIAGPDFNFSDKGLAYLNPTFKDINEVIHENVVVVINQQKLSIADKDMFNKAQVFESKIHEVIDKDGITKTYHVADLEKELKPMVNGEFSTVLSFPLSFQHKIIVSEEQEPTYEPRYLNYYIDKEASETDNLFKVTSVHNADDSYTFKGIDMMFNKYELRYGFGESFYYAGQAWVNGTGAIARAIGGLFVGSGWGNVGSIISIFTQTSSVLVDMGFAYYLNIWGVISCNLALFNLLPFPGLDGWQLLVTGVEGISKKKIPNKAKNIMSIIGMVLLFGLMAALVIKDIVMLIIGGA